MRFRSFCNHVLGRISFSDDDEEMYYEPLMEDANLLLLPLGGGIYLPNHFSFLACREKAGGCLEGLRAEKGVLNIPRYLLLAFSIVVFATPRVLSSLVQARPWSMLFHILLSTPRHD